MLMTGTNGCHGDWRPHRGRILQGDAKDPWLSATVFLELFMKSLGSIVSFVGWGSRKTRKEQGLFEMLF